MSYAEFFKRATRTDEEQDGLKPFPYQCRLAEKSCNAHVDRIKVIDYLLSLSHPDGQSKAQFFRRFGFKSEEWQVLAEALRVVGVSNPVVSVVASPHGVRYTVDGPIQSPDGQTPMVRTVWIAERGDAPRLITAHPL